MEYQDVELVIRVKLPNPINYLDCLNGEDAIFAIRPPGYEVIWETKENPWLIDKEGYSWVRLTCKDKTIVLNYWKQSASDAIMALIKLKENIRKLKLEI